MMYMMMRYILCALRNATQPKRCAGDIKRCRFGSAAWITIISGILVAYMWYKSAGVRPYTFSPGLLCFLF